MNSHRFPLEKVRFSITVMRTDLRIYLEKYNLGVSAIMESSVLSTLQSIVADQNLLSLFPEKFIHDSVCKIEIILFQMILNEIAGLDYERYKKMGCFVQCQSEVCPAPLELLSYLMSELYPNFTDSKLYPIGEGGVSTSLISWIIHVLNERQAVAIRTSVGGGDEFKKNIQKLPSRQKPRVDRYQKQKNVGIRKRKIDYHMNTLGRIINKDNGERFISGLRYIFPPAVKEYFRILNNAGITTFSITNFNRAISSFVPTVVRKKKKRNSKVKKSESNFVVSKSRKYTRNIGRDEYRCEVNPRSSPLRFNVTETAADAVGGKSVEIILHDLHLPATRLGLGFERVQHTRTISPKELNITFSLQPENPESTVPSTVAVFKFPGLQRRVWSDVPKDGIRTFDGGTLFQYNVRFEYRARRSPPNIRRKQRKRKEKKTGNESSRKKKKNSKKRIVRKYHVIPEENRKESNGLSEHSRNKCNSGTLKCVGFDLKKNQKCDLHLKSEHGNGRCRNRDVHGDDNYFCEYNCGVIIQVGMIYEMECSACLREKRCSFRECEKENLVETEEDLVSLDFCSNKECREKNYELKYFHEHCCKFVSDENGVTLRFCSLACQKKSIK